jgi:PIN domain nuclease of toxin-antitoxin system
MSEAFTAFDASAILAYLRDESGADRVAEHLILGGVISAVNWAEVLARLVVGGGSLDDPAARALVSGAGAPVTVIPFDEVQARETARIKKRTTGVPLSLGDRACLALGRLRDLPVMTTDREWRKLRLGIRVVLVR